MDLTITEALRIKNEIAAAVNTLKYSTHNASFGVTKEDDVIVSEDKEKFQSVEDRLIRALSLSEEINDKIASFNKENKIDSTVRKMQNAKLLLEVYNRVLPQTKPKKNSRFENIGNGVRKQVNVEYVPDMSSKDLKSKIAAQKTAVREFQTIIEKLNQNSISLTFEYSDVESLVE